MRQIWEYSEGLPDGREEFYEFSLTHALAPMGEFQVTIQADPRIG